MNRDQIKYAAMFTMRRIPGTGIACMEGCQRILDLRYLILRGSSRLSSRSELNITNLRPAPSEKRGEKHWLSRLVICSVVTNAAVYKVKKNNDLALFFWGAVYWSES